MASKINPILKLTPETYKDKAYSSITELSKALQSESELLSPIVTMIGYTSQHYEKNHFPLLFNTEGFGKTKGLKKLSNANFEYKYPIMGNLKVTSQVMKSYYVAGNKAGLGGAYFKIVFADRWFSRNQILYPFANNAFNMQCQVKQDPTQLATGGWEYTLKLLNPLPSAFMPIASMKEGATWSGGTHKVGFERSKGTESRSQLPAMATNMVSFSRRSYKYTGNVAKKVMKFEIPIGGKTFRTYMDWELFLMEMKFKCDIETDLWTSQYGKNANGEFFNYDDETQVPITSGAGVDQQIPPANSDSVSFMTTNKWKNIVRDVTVGINDTIERIKVYTGKGGFEDFDNAMKNDLKAFATPIDFTGKVVEGQNSWSMTYGSYFGMYRLVDGQVLELIHNPAFDNGEIAQSSPKHPLTGLPLTSHNYYFLDDSNYSGEANLQYISEDGKEFTKVVAGVNGVPIGYQDSVLVSTDRDETSIEKGKSHGVQIFRPSSCFKLINSLTGF